MFERAPCCRYIPQNTCGFLADFSYFEKNRVGLWDLVAVWCVCVCLSSIVAREPLCKNPLAVARQPLDKNSPIFARQRLGRNYVITLLSVCVPIIVSFSMRPVSYQRKVGDSFFLELLVLRCITGHHDTFKHEMSFPPNKFVRPVYILITDRSMSLGRNVHTKFHELVN
jgi:hypothetical protein